jgi:hypothetical protein
MNADVYPLVHYPEVYILEGGYSGYYNAYPVSSTNIEQDPSHSTVDRMNVPVM